MSEKDCFVIAPIGEAESDTRKRSDQILKHVISPALKECGYKATRADQISEPWGGVFKEGFKAIAEALKSKKD